MIERNRIWHRPVWALLVTAAVVVAVVSSHVSPSVGLKGASPSVALAAPGHIKMGGTVVIDNVSGSLWTCALNPYTGTNASNSAGIFYEPLVYINTLTSKRSPWLATAWAWSNGNKRLTFTLRQGVTWSDGKPFTAADVVFTFHLLKRFPALDLQAVWTVLSNVTAQGNQVVFTFKKVAVPFFFYIADQDWILPQHIWSKIAKPDTYVDRQPIGTGPFLLRACGPQNMTYVRNPHYWGAPKPYIDTVQYPAFIDNQPGNLYLAQGKANYGGQYIPRISQYYISHDPAHRHVWDPPSGLVGLFPNLTTFPTNSRLVREAIAYAIDKNKVSRLGVYGYLPPADQTGIVLPNFRSWFNAKLAARMSYNYNPAKSAALMRQAGFTKGSNGFWQKNGKTVSLSIINVGGFTDWVSELEIVRANLKSAGFDANAEELSGDTWNARKQKGDFQLAWSSCCQGGDSPYYGLKDLLYSANSAPIGQKASTNFERWRSQYTDGLLDKFARTASFGRQHAYIVNLEKVMLTQLPFIAVLEGVNWYQYDTKDLVGWPTPQDPYVNPSPYNLPDWEIVLQNVHLR